MIFDKIENWQRYLGISGNMDKALAYMAGTDLSSLEDGRHEIDGNNVFVNVMQAATDPGKKEYEFHEEYYDIQIDLAGCEDIWFSTEFQEITRPYGEDGDIGMGTCKCEAVCHLSPGRFAVCEPREPHLPGVAPGSAGEKIRKAVIKV
ncbi:MAG: YhcH/YjgK/YiaL family protein, partial [Lachnospiraceae bacterium]|nr:YhcH/YjgK/YiaL family protein [Lachnospiraceae bacterium]